MAPEELLRLGSKEALYTMAQEYLDNYHPGTVAGWYRATPPIAIDSTLTQVLFTLERVSTPVEKWGELLEFTIQYHRIDISRVIKPTDVVPCGFPTSKYDLVKVVLEKYGIPLNANEITSASVVTAGPVNIVTDEDGYRWVGSGTITAEEDNRSLLEVIERNNVVTNFSTNYSSQQVRRDIVSHLNEHNKGKLLPRLTFEHVQLSAPVAVNAITDNVNTRIVLSAITGLYSGSGNVFYKRKHFSYTWRKPIEFTYNGELMVSEILPALSERLNCTIALNDIYDVAVTPPSRHNPTEVMITFRPESAGYIGEMKVLFNE